MESTDSDHTVEVVRERILAAGTLAAPSSPDQVRESLEEDILAEDNPAAASEKGRQEHPEVVPIAERILVAARAGLDLRNLAEALAS